MKPPTMPTVNPTNTSRKTGACTPAMMKSNIAGSALPVVVELLHVKTQHVRETLGHQSERKAQQGHDQHVPQAAPGPRLDALVLEGVLELEPLRLLDLPRHEHR